MEPYIGEIKLFGFYFNPRGYLLCQGQLLNIAQNTALFSLLGTNYGGNGQTTFGIPDLRGRSAIGQGQGGGLQNYAIGQVGGTENTTLTLANMPAHTHTATATTTATATSTLYGEGGVGDKLSPAGNLSAALQNAFKAPQSTDNVAYSSEAIATTVNATTSVQVGITGSSLPFSILNPYLTLNYSIATEGIFPSRN